MKEDNLLPNSVLSKVEASSSQSGQRLRDLLNTGNLVSIKYQDADIIFDLSGNSLVSSPEYKETLQAIEECNAITSVILDQFSEIDSSIRNFKNAARQTSESFHRFAESNLNTIDKLSRVNKNSETLGLMALGSIAIAAVGSVINLGGSIIGNIKEKQAKAERDRNLEAAMEKKKEIAEEKYDHILKFKNYFDRTVVNKVKVLYQTEITKVVVVGEQSFISKVSMFKLSLGLYLKTQFLDKTLAYLIAEMDAWKEGKHDSEKNAPSMMAILDNTLLKWPFLLGKKVKWTTFLKMYLQNDSNSYPVPFMLLLSEPALLSNCIGINLKPIGNCPNALIQSDWNSIDLSSYPIADIIQNNPYYIDCKQNLTTNFAPPSYPETFGTKDYLYLMIPPVLSFLINLISFILFPGLFLRVLSVLCSVVVILAFWDAFSGVFGILPHTGLPYERAYKCYEEQYDNMIQTIRTREEEYRKKNNHIK